MGKKHGDPDDHGGHEHSEACAHGEEHAGHEHAHEHGEACRHGAHHEDDHSGDDDIVELEGPDGTVEEYLFLGTVELDGDTFALLTPKVEEDPESESTDVYVFHYEQDEDGADIYQAVEDDALLARVQEEAEKLFTEAAAEEDE